jgi:hypothetical protein
MPTADELRALSKRPAHELGICQRGCAAPGQYEHVDANGRRWFLCGVCWHKAQGESTK